MINNPNRSCGTVFQTETKAAIRLLIFATFAANRLPSQTVEAERRGRISGEAFGFNVLATIGAKAVFALVYAFQRRVDLLPFDGAAAGLGLGHGLILQRIHAGETPDGLLIQLHRFLALLTCCIFCVEVFEACVEAVCWRHG